MPYNKKAVKTAIRDAMARVVMDAIAKVCFGYLSRLEKVVAADGSHIG